MKRIALTILLSCLFYNAVYSRTVTDVIMEKLEKELSLSGNLFLDQRVQVMRVSFVVREDGTVKVNAVNAATETLRNSVKKEIEKLKFPISDHDQEKNILLKVELK